MTAPVNAGKYKVIVTVRSADTNYHKAAFAEKEFIISKAGEYIYHS